MHKHSTATQTSSGVTPGCPAPTSLAPRQVLRAKAGERLPAKDKGYLSFSNRVFLPSCFDIDGPGRNLLSSIILALPISRSSLQRQPANSSRYRCCTRRDNCSPSTVVLTLAEVYSSLGFHWRKNSPCYFSTRPSNEQQVTAGLDDLTVLYCTSTSSSRGCFCLTAFRLSPDLHGSTGPRVHGSTARRLHGTPPFVPRHSATFSNILYRRGRPKTTVVARPLEPNQEGRAAPRYRQTDLATCNSRRASWR